MEEPLVSAVIPAYNHGRYIRQAIESVIAQTYGNIELLIINDGSTDDTHERITDLLEACRARFVRFEYLNSENRGLIRTLNHALDWARGPYFTALASDDAWFPSKTALQVEALEADADSRMCYGRALLIDEESRPTPHQTDHISYKGGRIFEDLFLMRFHMPVTYMWRRSVFDEVGRYAEGLVQEDLYMNLKIAERYPIHFIDSQIAYYRIFPTMTFKRDPVKLYESYRQILELFRNHPLFSKAYNEYRINRFWTFSGFAKYKAEALHLLPLLRPGEGNVRIMKGLVKLLLVWKAV